MIKKILVANRGEIACRVINTCREMGIPTVAVYSEADRKALHTLRADYAIYIGESEASESYLNIDRIIAAAKSTGADAIHPGYGFLSENADFAQRCIAEGLVFIGPPANVIRNMGDKRTARQLMDESGVPIIPGATITQRDAAARQAEEIGYPIIVKASAGGGGKGMRVVNRPQDLEDACAAASREALKAFGNSTIYLEKYFSKTKHIEFQILADADGNVIHLLERECSIQRRHQKIVEESPSSALSPSLRRKMGQAAVAAARAAGYVNAGTVEFLLNIDKTFYFLEINTRLQVEHPVTEMITGIDIVRQQIEIASGNSLAIRQDQVTATGHAIECRIYAEDPENAFMPSPGTLSFIREPTGPGIRNDCGVYLGCMVPMDYDPIISKLIVHATNRTAAIKKMVKALREYVILGVKASTPFLIDLLDSKHFCDGEIFTDFIEKYFREWKPDAQGIDEALIAYIVDELSGKTQSPVAQTPGGPLSPWETLGNWRLG